MKLLKQISQTGWRYSFAIAFNRIVPQWLFRCRRYVVYQLDPAIAKNEPSSQIKVAYCENEAQILAVENLTRVSRNEVAVDGSEDSSGLCSVQATIDSRLAGGFWTAANQFQEHELGVRYVLSPNQVWLFSAYVSKSERGQGVYSELLRHVVAAEKDKGHTEALVAVNPDNHRSNRVHQKNSTRTIGTVFSIRLLKFALCRVQGDLNCDRLITVNSTAKPILIRFETSA